MEQPKIDFLKEKYDLVKPDEKPFLFFRKALIISFFVLATFGAAFSFRINTTSDGQNGETKISLFSIIKNFILPGDDALNGETEDRVNFLLTGVGGEGHEGPQLTDTILFASYRPSTKKLAFLSLPRDMTVPIPNHGYQKVNAVNAYAEKEKPGTGAATTAEFIGNTVRQPVHYYMRVDFAGFEELINTIGGVDVTVDNAFTDQAYPIPGKGKDTCGNSKASMNATQEELLDTTSGPTIPAPDYSCRFKVLNFKTGTQHMDGETALSFVRSRHGNNGEGSDFARSRRQQKIMMAVKDKLFSASTFLNPVRITGIFDTLQKNISTNLSVAQLMRLGKEFKDLKSEEVVSHVIDDSPNSPLYSTTLNGAYVLLPKNDDWTTLQQMAQYIYTPEPTSAPAAKFVQVEPVKTTEPAVRIEIQNGTTVTGLAFRASQLLNTHEEFDVIKVGNAVTRDYNHTVIYDLTNGAKPNDLKSLQTFFQADIAKATGWMKDGQVVPAQVAVTADDTKQITTTTSEVDFLVILGQSAQNLVLN
jgi:LCP family protein required for cell wall assembly